MRGLEVVQRCVGTGLVAGIALACGGGDRIGGAEALAARTTKAAVADFAGGEPARCVFSAPGLELCSFRIAPEEDAWAVLVGDAETEGELNLLCEFPIDGSARADGSCETYPRNVQAASDASGLPPVGAPGSLENRRAAERRLGAALTVRSLSQLVGDAPERCRTGSGVQTCEWSLTEDAASYGLLASLVDDAGSGSAVRLRCVLPLDGSVRGADSCAAAWSD